MMQAHPSMTPEGEVICCSGFDQQIDFPVSQNGFSFMLYF
jgi:hypothetical protein